MPAATTAPGYSRAEAQPAHSPEPSRLVNGLVPPPLIAVLALFADSRQVMRRYGSGRLSTVLVSFALPGHGSRGPRPGNQRPQAMNAVTVDGCSIDRSQEGDESVSHAPR